MMVTYITEKENFKKKNNNQKNRIESKEKKKSRRNNHNNRIGGCGLHHMCVCVCVWLAEHAFLTYLSA